MAMDEFVKAAIDIASAQASVRSMKEEELAVFIRNVSAGIKRVAELHAQGVYSTDAVAVSRYDNPKKSIRERTVECMVCGKHFKVLTKRHLALHNLTPEEYKEKFGLKKDTPLVCKSLIRERRAQMDEMKIWEKRRGAKIDE